MASIEAGIIGLGKFGLRFGQALVRLGHQVIGVDVDSGNVQRASQVLTQVYQADATEKRTLIQLGFGDLKYVLVSVGDSIAASCMICMFLKELGVPMVWAKAADDDHEKLLRKIGADDVIIPEIAAAKDLANRLAIPGFLEYLPFGKNIALKEIPVSKWAEKSLRELNLPKEKHVQIIAVKDPQGKDIRFVPGADEPLKKGEVLIAMGYTRDLVNLEG